MSSKYPAEGSQVQAREGSQNPMVPTHRRGNPARGRSSGPFAPLERYRRHSHAGAWKRSWILPPCDAGFATTGLKIIPSILRRSWLADLDGVWFMGVISHEAWVLVQKDFSLGVSRWFPRSGVGTQPKAAPAARSPRWSGAFGIPTPERGNDQSKVPSVLRLTAGMAEDAP
jgi:hypothetical protein